MTLLIGAVALNSGKRNYSKGSLRNDEDSDNKTNVNSPTQSVD